MEGILNKLRVFLMMLPMTIFIAYCSERIEISIASFILLIITTILSCSEDIMTHYEKVDYIRRHPIQHLYLPFTLGISLVLTIFVNRTMFNAVLVLVSYILLNIGLVMKRYNIKFYVYMITISFLFATMPFMNTIVYYAVLLGRGFVLKRMLKFILSIISPVLYYICFRKE